VRLLARILTRGFPYLTVLAALIGLAFPGPAGAIYAAIPILVMIMMAGVGATISLSAILGEWRRWPWIVLILVGQGIVLPLTGILVGFLSSNPADRLGLLLASVAPVEASASVLILLAGGSEPLGIALLLGSSISTVVVMPFALKLAGHSSIAVAPAGVALWLLVVVVGPLLLGSAMRGRFFRTRDPRPAAGAVSAAAVLLIIYGVGSLRPAVGGPGQWLLLVLACLGLNAAGYASGWYGMRALQASREDCVAVLFTGGMREFGIAVGLALQFFGPEPAVAAALYGLTTMVTPGLVLMWVWSGEGQRPISPEEHRPT
jgi:bile acid:Na+ symporter, BASS family